MSARTGDDGTGLAAAQDPDHAGVRDAGLHLDAKRLQVRRDQRRQCESPGSRARDCRCMSWRWAMLAPAWRSTSAAISALVGLPAAWAVAAATRQAAAAVMERKTRMQSPWLLFGEELAPEVAERLELERVAATDRAGTSSPVRPTWPLNRICGSMTKRVPRAA